MLVHSLLIVKNTTELSVFNQITTHTQSQIIQLKLTVSLHIVWQSSRFIKILTWCQKLLFFGIASFYYKFQQYFELVSDLKQQPQTVVIIVSLWMNTVVCTFTNIV